MKIATFAIIFSIVASSTLSSEMSEKRRKMIREFAQDSITLWAWVSTRFDACPYQPEATGLIQKAHPDCGEKQTLSLSEWYEQQVFLCEYQPFQPRKNLYTRDELCREMVEVMAEHSKSTDN